MHRQVNTLHMSDQLKKIKKIKKTDHKKQIKNSTNVQNFIKKTYRKSDSSDMEEEDISERHDLSPEEVALLRGEVDDDNDPSEDEEDDSEEDSDENEDEESDKEDDHLDEEDEDDDDEDDDDDDDAEEESEEEDSDEDYSDDDDEGSEGYKIGGYHPVKVGEVYHRRYLVLKKLGWGHFSTVWLVRDSKTGAIVALKVQKSAEHYTEAAYDEIELLKATERGKFAKGPKHSALRERKSRVVKLIDSFEHAGPHGVSEKEWKRERGE